MSYLNKSERKKLILEVAKSIALEEGLNTLTVRYIAQKASLSVGLIHHHFQSIHELKSEVFTQLTAENLNLIDINENICWKDKLLKALGFFNTEEELAYIRLWNDAEKISQTMPDFSKTYWNAIEAWQTQIINILKIITPSPPQNIEDLAWQLISLTLGFERLEQFNPDLLSPQYISHLVVQTVEVNF